MNKKENIIILIILTVLVLLIATILTFIVYTKDETNYLYRYTKSHFQSGVLASDEFIIYKNGLVITDEIYEEDKFKISKITKEEVQELESLIETVEDNKKYIENPEKSLENMYKIIYNKDLSKKIILYGEGIDSSYINTSENCEEILELVDKIYNKHKKK